MAIADRVTASSDVGGATSLTYAHAVAGTTDLAIWVCVDDFRNPTSADPSGITYAGGALTKIANYLGGTGNDNTVSLWRRLAPATGSNNVVVTHNQAHDITAVSISYSGVDQATPNDTVQVNDVATPDPTHNVTSATGDVVVSFVGGWGTAGDAWQAAGDLTERLENNNTSGVNSIAVGDAPGAASVTATWNSVTNPSDNHGQLSFNINQATGGGGGSVSQELYIKRQAVNRAYTY